MADLSIDDDPEEVNNSPEDESYCPTTPEKMNAMDEDDDGETPHRITRRTGKRALVVSPTHEQPPSQHKKLTHPVSYPFVIWNPDC
jgi:hypothetical protein